MWLGCQRTARAMSVAAAKAEERLIWYVQASVAGLIAPPPGLDDALEALTEFWQYQKAVDVGRRIMRERHAVLAALS